MQRDYAPGHQIVSVSFRVDPVLIALDSLQLLSDVERLSGLGPWVYETAVKLTPHQQQINRVIFDLFNMVLFRNAQPSESHDSFLSYLAELATRDPETLITQYLENVCDELVQDKEKPTPSVADLRADAETFRAFIRENFYWVDPKVTDEDILYAHTMVHAPGLFVQTVTDHLRGMYVQYLAEEWERTLPMLRESVAAFQRMRYENLTANEAIRAITSRDMTDKLEKYHKRIDHIAFIPSPHIGPYVSMIKGDSTTSKIIFGARLPRGQQATSSALTRSELLTRLNALSDDTRLRILELLTRHDEMCAQDIIEQIGLSQPTISRHLSQLTATGYLIERRRDVSKCYSLNTDRVLDTLRALSAYLSRQTELQAE